MNDLSNIMDESVYLARDYASIIRWFTKKLKYLTTEWTDLTVSEPDTLTLSFISYVYDLLNYLVDHRYIDTMFSQTNSIRYLSYLYKLVGSELNDYESSLIQATVTNKSNSTIYINKLDILRMSEHHNEVFTCIDNYEIQPKTDLQISIIRGTPVYKIYKLSDIVTGFFVLPDKNINRNLVLVSIDGGENLTKVDDALFEETPCYQVSQYGEYLTSIRLSPSAFRSINSYVLVTYTINDDYQIAKGSQLVLLNNEYSDDYEIYTDTTNSLNSITLDDIKYRYMKELSEVTSIYNNTYDISLLKIGRIDYLNYKYNSNSIYKESVIEYDTGKVILSIAEVPSDNMATIKYICTNEETTDRINFEKIIELDSTWNEIQLEIPENYILEPMSLVITYSNDILCDTAGDNTLNLVHTDSKIIFNYSTTDDNPITDLINNGTINYNSGSLVLEFNYIPSSNIIVSYEVNTDGEITQKKEYFDIITLSSYLALDIDAMTSSIVPNSLKIVNNYNIIIDDGDGNLIVNQSDESVLINEILDRIMINRTRNDIVLNKLAIKKINVDAVVYLYSSDVSTDSILEDIKSALTNAYAKGTHEPGVTVNRLSILLNIEQSSPSIKYAVLQSPISDVSVDINQISEIGSINISFERSDN